MGERGESVVLTCVQDGEELCTVIRQDGEHVRMLRLRKSPNARYEVNGERWEPYRATHLDPDNPSPWEPEYGSFEEAVGIYQRPGEGWIASPLSRFSRPFER